MTLGRLRQYRALRDRIKTALEDVGVPRPWDIEEFARRLGERRGRHLELLPYALPPQGPDAVWLAGPTVDLVVFDGDTDDLHREHLILHELCHIVLRHQGADDLQVAPSLLRTLGLAAPGAESGVAGEWHSELHRATYGDDQEREAELAATLVWKKAGLRLAPRGPRLLRGPEADAVDRLAEVMGRTIHA